MNTLFRHHDVRPRGEAARLRVGVATAADHQRPQLRAPERAELLADLERELADRCEHECEDPEPAQSSSGRFKSTTSRRKCAKHHISSQPIAATFVRCQHTIGKGDDELAEKQRITPGLVAFYVLDSRRLRV